MKHKLIVAAGLALVAVAASPTLAQPTQATKSEAPGPTIKPWGYPLDAFDRAIAPGDDFFGFANGGWAKATPIPDDRTAIGFNVEMTERNEARIEAIIQGFSTARLSPGGDAQKIRDLYASFMDVAGVEARGLAPLSADLKKIAEIVDHAGVARAIADGRLGLDGPFATFVAVDGGPPRRWRLTIAHSGLGLPDKSYYFRDEPRLKSAREAYKEHLAKLFTLASIDDAQTRAARVYALEEAIAERHWEVAERREAEKVRNPMSLAELESLAPDYPWAAHLEAAGLNRAQLAIVAEKSAFAPLAELFSQTPVEAWRDYLTVRLLSSHAEFLTKAFDEEGFAFFGKILSGQNVQRPRDRRAIALVNGQLDQAVGKLYIERYFPAEAKAQVRDMIENIRAVLRERIVASEWMGEDTKKAAITKLEKITPKVAYPEKWRSFRGLEIEPDDLVGNIQRLRTFEAAEGVRRLDRPVDPREWFTAPQTVNAFYSPDQNEIYIPAGYIQSPLFDPEADAAINYGALGSIIGHEIGHGFDDQGSKYDGDGVLRSWWTDEDRARFDARGDRLAAQYDAYEFLPGLFVNGRATLGENIGDLAGMTLTYHAYLRSLKGAEPPVLDGFTGPQRVFLGRAQARRLKRTEASERRGLVAGVHSPHPLRVNGVVRNMDEWYEAFGVQPGEALYLAPDERVRIW